MKVTFGYQHFDSNPDEIKKEDTLIDLSKALELFNSFPWAKQFQGASKRQESNLTSTRPALFFFETEVKFLSISAYNHKGFFIYFRDSNKNGELFLPRNILIKPEGISVEQLIDDFFSQKIHETLELFEFKLEQTEEVNYKLDCKTGRLFLPLLLTLIPFIYLFIDESIDRTPILQSTIYMSGVILILTLPNIFLNISYWKNDNNKIISYNPNNKLLTIKTQNKTYEIEKSKIEIIELVQTRVTQGVFQDYRYLRFKVGDLKFIVTYLTIDPMELLLVLNLNFRIVEKFFPKLNHIKEIKKENQNANNDYDYNREELLKSYSNWDTERLEEIVAKTDEYSDYAISVAKEILEIRKNN